jgi:hypothetical protein
MTAGTFGCARSANDQFTPTEDTAATCLEAVLGAWRDGQPAVELADRQPGIRVADTCRLPGQELQAFEVLSRSRGSAAGWTFVVRLRFDNPLAEERARFVVVGVDPIWVFRKEDYDKLAHWEHPMELPEPSPTEDKTPSAVQSEATPTSASATSNERS